MTKNHPPLAKRVAQGFRDDLGVEKCAHIGPFANDERSIGARIADRLAGDGRLTRRMVDAFTLPGGASGWLHRAHRRMETPSCIRQRKVRDAAPKRRGSQDGIIHSPEIEP